MYAIIIKDSCVFGLKYIAALGLCEIANAYTKFYWTIMLQPSAGQKNLWVFLTPVVAKIKT